MPKKNRFEPYHKHFLKQYTGRDYDEFGFDDAYFRDLLDHMGLTPKDVDLGAFEFAHFKALSAFLQTNDIQTRHMTIEQENDALIALQDQVEKLAKTLADLPFQGQIAARLVREAQEMPKTHFNHEGTRLPNLVNGTLIQPFESLTDLLFDLRVAMERAKIRRPKKPVPHTYRFQDIKAWQELRKAQFLDFVESGFDESPAARHKRLREEHSLPANAALLAFIEAFEEMWHEFSPFQFTESRYEKEDAQYSQRTVDAAEHCLQKFGMPYRKSIIYNKIREVRKARYRES